MHDPSPHRPPGALGSTLFRVEALQYRLEHRGRRTAVLSLPPAMSRQARIVLWGLLGLLGLAGAGVCVAPVSVTVPAMAVAGPDGDLAIGAGERPPGAQVHVPAGTFLPLVGRVFEE